jgi:hypothetical protein
MYLVHLAVSILERVPPQSMGSIVNETEEKSNWNRRGTSSDLAHEELNCHAAAIDLHFQGKRKMPPRKSIGQ